MLKKIVLTSIIIGLYLITCYAIYKNVNPSIEKEIKNTIPDISQKQPTKTIDDSIGELIINKINLNQKLYSPTNHKNNIEENVTILKESIFPNEENSIVFLAAHSGTGKIAFFQNLNKLEIKDKIILNYQKHTYTYQVTNIWEENKTGTIHVSKKEKNQLILTTCSPNKENKQLVIESIQKEA